MITRLCEDLARNHTNDIITINSISSLLSLEWKKSYFTEEKPR